MKLSITPISIPRPPFNIDYSSKLFFIGSCFSEHIGSRLKKLKFDTVHNPFGVIYNAHSLASAVNALLKRESFTKDDLTYQNELWFSYLHYTLFSDVDSERCLEKINNSFYHAKPQLQSAQVLFLTLGSSYAFRLKETGMIVTNCHKMPANAFDRFFSGPAETSEILRQTIKQIRLFNPQIQLVFTVSPIRHLSDGAIENQRSKASLILAIAELEREIPGIYYFPAYEIFMDELRDYRYYATDMVHPSEYAIDYIWEKFTETLFSSEAKSISLEIEKLLQSMNHRPRHSGTEAYRKFQLSLLKKIELLSSHYPFLDFTEELLAIKAI